MKITSKGQVTIPLEIREKAGLLPDTEVEFLYDGNTVRIVKAATSKKQSRGSKLVSRMRGKGDLGLSTDQIMALTRGA